MNGYEKLGLLLFISANQIAAIKQYVLHENYWPWVIIALCGATLFAFFRD